MKGLILTLVVAVPLGIVLFLEIFGDNQFEVPVFHQQATVIEECSLDIDGPYTVGAASDFGIEGIGKQSGITIFWWDDEAMASGTTERELRRISSEDGVILKDFQTSGDSTTSFRVFTPEEQLGQFFRCGLLVSDENLSSWVVVMDKQRRIRGYYDITDVNELTRLEAEIKILLEEERG